jgi:NTP pyrophosphatase (non-canonical NTP hydrolase)
MKHNFNELAESVLAWAARRDLIAEKNAKNQMLKVFEEVGELSGALAKGKDKDAIMDGIGDTFVTVLILAFQLGLDPSECLDKAYNEIANRNGKTVNGVFVKNADL